MKFLAEIFATLWSVGALKERMMRDVYGHLYSSDGALYMGRWAVIKTGSWQAKALWCLTLGRYDHCRLHWIKQADADRELHDHPFDYRTFILDGWYTEQDFDGMHLRQVGESARNQQGSFHRIAAVPQSGVWTLFFMGHDVGSWGFLVDGEWIKSHDFFKLRNIRADGTKETT